MRFGNRCAKHFRQTGTVVRCLHQPKLQYTVLVARQQIRRTDLLIEPGVADALAGAARLFFQQCAINIRVAAPAQQIRLLSAAAAEHGRLRTVYLALNDNPLCRLRIMHGEHRAAEPQETGHEADAYRVLSLSAAQHRCREVPSFLPQCSKRIRERINAGGIHGQYHSGVFKSAIDTLCVPVCLHGKSLFGEPRITGRCQPPAVCRRVRPQILLLHQRGHNRRPENAAKIVFTLTIYVLAPPDEPHHRQYGLYAQMITFPSEITALSYQVSVIEFVLLQN